jgi:hypothetical protein
MSDDRVFNLLETMRKENNEQHEQLGNRISSLEITSAERRGWHKAITFIVGLIGALGGLLLGGK